MENADPRKQRARAELGTTYIEYSSGGKACIGEYPKY